MIRQVSTGKGCGALFPPKAGPRIGALGPAFSCVPRVGTPRSIPASAATDPDEDEVEPFVLQIDQAALCIVPLR